MLKIKKREGTLPIHQLSNLQLRYLSAANSRILINQKLLKELLSDEVSFLIGTTNVILRSYPALKINSGGHGRWDCVGCLYWMMSLGSYFIWTQSWGLFFGLCKMCISDRVTTSLQACDDHKVTLPHLWRWRVSQTKLKQHDSCQAALMHDSVVHWPLMIGIGRGGFIWKADNL